MAPVQLWEDGWRHVPLGDVGSTNDVAVEYAQNGDPGNLWVTAERQLSGKGRRGRQWVSESGNLYASLLLIEPAPREHISVAPLLAALSLYDALQENAGLGDRLKIKWPNDLLLDGAKIAGILLESQMIAGRTSMVMGFGINLTHAPAETPYPATTLARSGASISPQEMHLALHRAIKKNLERWDQGRNNRAIVAAWRAAAMGIGSMIKVNLHDKSLEGKFVDIDADGQLMLQIVENRTISIATGDVFFTPQSV